MRLPERHCCDQCARYFIEEVADHTLMLLLAAGRRVKLMDQLVREGRWYEGRPILNHVPRLWGQTLGLISFGNVAQRLPGVQKRSECT